MKSFSIILITILSLPVFIVSQEKPPNTIRNEWIKSVDEKVPQLMEKFSIPGLSLTVIKNGKIDLSKSYGIKNIITKEAVNDSTIFMAASLTKPLFAYLVLKLHDEGKINIDVPLYTYIPKEVLEKYFIGHAMEREGFNAERFKKITGRMVLCHTTGLPMYNATDPLEISFEPGTNFRYSPYSFGLLEIALYCTIPANIANFTGTELDGIMRKYVFNPLGMNQSSMVWEDRFENNAVVGHNLFMTTSGKFLKNTKASGAASLYTTANDYARFLIAIMNGEGLKRETASAMLKPQINVDEENNFWGLGIGLEKAGEDYYFWHWGDYGLLKSFALASNTKKDGIVFFANSYYGLCTADDFVKITIGGEHPLFDNSIMKNYVGPIKKWTHLFCMENINKGIELYNQEKLNNPHPISESLITAIGYEFMNEKRYNDAIAIFNLAVEDYPNSYDAFDGLAEAYMKAGNEKDAEINYQKSLQLNPENKNAEKMLNKLRSEN